MTITKTMTVNYNSRTVNCKTQHEVRAQFIAQGICIADWARENGFTPSLVYDIISGRKKCMRGQSHQIAVLLGLKQSLQETKDSSKSLIIKTAKGDQKMSP